jgi:hypothetical protein
MLAKSGSSTYWMHRDHAGSRTQPPPDYRWVHKTTREERDSDPGDPETWRRINLWRGHAYFYDADAVREEASDVSLVRIAQPNFAQQTGGPKDYGTTGVNASRSMRRTLENFAANPGRNLRNVWTIATAPFSDWGETVRQVRVARDAGVDGMKRKASPDCPAHGDHPAPAANADDDAHADGSLSHIARNGGRLVQEQAGGFAPTGPHHMLMNERQSSDLPLLGYGPSAMLHSNRSHRTDLAPATSPACSAAAETDDGTARTSEPQVSVGSADRTLRSNSEPGDLGGSPSNRTASRIAHTPGEQALSSASDPSLCTCEWYIEKTEKTSHFATFPPELAARCIKAGSSERGCCAACGAPWVRVTETTRTKDLTRHTGRAAVGCDDRTDSDWPRMIATATTTGWSPSCRCRSDACDAPYQVEPCTVLDPFSGAGTALLVADRLGRDAVGIDLSHAYVEMTKERLHADCPLFMDIGPSPPPAEDPEDARMADLFDVAADQSLIGRGCRYRMAGSTGRLAR